MTCRVLLADRDTVFADMFERAVEMRYSERIQLSVVTDPGYLEGRLQDTWDVLLADSVMVQAVPRDYAGRVCVLTAEPDETHERFPVLFRYQHAERLTGRLLQLAVPDTAPARQRCVRVALTGPCGGAGRSSLAEALALKLAGQGRRPLLLSADGFSNHRQSAGPGLSEVLFYLQEGQNPGGHWLPETDPAGVMRYRAPACGRDTAAVQSGEWIRLVQWLGEHAAAETLILDAPAGMTAAAQAFMQAADVCWVVVLPEQQAQGKAFSEEAARLCRGTLKVLENRGSGLPDSGYLRQGSPGEALERDRLFSEAVEHLCRDTLGAGAGHGS